VSSYLNWHVGMKVVCANADGKRIYGDSFKPQDNGEQKPKVGKVYTIRALMAFGGGVYLHLDEVHNSPRHYLFPDGVCRHVETPWHASYFRPVQTRKTDISIFTAMLHGTDQTVDA
jgi:hypothetical protein